MPPQRTLHVDVNKLLATIATHAEAQRAATRERLSVDSFGPDVARDLVDQARWAPRDLTWLAGRPLTASERIRHQQAMRKLEADGLVVLGTRHVRLTEAGREHVAKLQRAAVDG